MEKSLLNLLKTYSEQNPLAMHMPGHKRNDAAAEYLKALGGRYDITEIAGFDNLHDPSGILKEAMALAADTWGSSRSFFLVNGSTCGILAAIRAYVSSGQKVLVARNCHKSVFHALELNALDAVFLLPEYLPEYGLLGCVTPESVQAALDAHPDAKLIVLTSPTYDGILSDIGAICRAAHARGIPVLVDEAHGAHLDFCDAFPGGAVKAGADAVIQSLHKTLPSLTQTAVAHIGGLLDPERFQAQADVFETSSPSYLLMASIDGCVRLIRTRGPELFSAWNRRLADFDRAISGVHHLRFPGRGAARFQGSSPAYGFDRSKILVSVRGLNLSGIELANALRTRFRIEPEMAACDYALMMTGLTEPDGSLEALAEALCAIDAEILPAASESEPLGAQPFLPERRLPIANALRADRARVSLDDALGRVSAQYAWAYPPGIPLIVPGECVDERFLSAVRRMVRAGIPLCGGPSPNALWVIK